MRFNCGDSYIVWTTRLTNWHPFFALFPRKIGEKDGKDICAWLEWIERKGKFVSSYGDSGWVWEYRGKQ